MSNLTPAAQLPDLSELVDTLAEMTESSFMEATPMHAVDLPITTGGPTIGITLLFDMEEVGEGGYVEPGTTPREGYYYTSESGTLQTRYLEPWLAAKAWEAANRSDDEVVGYALEWQNGSFFDDGTHSVWHPDYATLAARVEETTTTNLPGPADTIETYDSGDTIYFEYTDADGQPQEFYGEMIEVTRANVRDWGLHELEV